MAVNDVYEVTHTQIDRGQVCTNVYFYFQDLEFVTTNPTKAQACAESWSDNILPIILDMQPAEVLTTEVKARNLFNDADAFAIPFSLPGAVAGDRQMFSTFNAFGFALNGDNPAVKNGSKRYVGVSEDYVSDGVVTGAPLITALDNIASSLVSPLLVGTIILDPVFVPVIVKRVRTGSPGAYEYRLPETSLESVISRVVVAIWDVIVTSQLSRKIGVGV